MTGFNSQDASEVSISVHLVATVTGDKLGVELAAGACDLPQSPRALGSEESPQGLILCCHQLEMPNDLSPCTGFHK